MVVEPQGSVGAETIDPAVIAAARAAIFATDVGVREVGNESATPVTSLSRNGAGVWNGPATNTFGSCNDNDGPPPAEVASVTVTPASATVVQGATVMVTSLSAAGSVGAP